MIKSKPLINKVEDINELRDHVDACNNGDCEHCLEIDEGVIIKEDVKRAVQYLKDLIWDLGKEYQNDKIRGLRVVSVGNIYEAIDKSFGDVKE